MLQQPGDFFSFAARTKALRILPSPPGVRRRLRLNLFARGIRARRLVICSTPGRQVSRGFFLAPAEQPID
jgi:hypothetical protein